MTRRREESGFTLIELLIVIVILGILAAIVVFAVNGIQDRGTASACKADVETVTVAAEAYDAQYGEYADSMQQLVKAGLLHSIPTSGSYSVDYQADNTSKTPSVTVSSTYCPSASADGPDSTGVSNDSAYCAQLSQTITTYSSLALASVDDGSLQELQGQVSKLQTLASADDAADWQQFGTAYTQVNQVLVRSGLRWSNLQTLDDGETPAGISVQKADQLQNAVQQRLSTGKVINAGQDLAASASSQCVLTLLR